MFVYISSTWTAVHTLDCSSLMASLFSIYHSNPVYCSRSTLVYVVQTTLKRRALPREQVRCADLRLEPLLSAHGVDGLDASHTSDP
jgi:hypothetical protein